MKPQKYQNVALGRKHGEKSWTIDGLNVSGQASDFYSDGDRDRMIVELSENESCRLEKYDPENSPVGVVETKRGLRFQNY